MQVPPSVSSQLQNLRKIAVLSVSTLIAISTTVDTVAAQTVDTIRVGDKSISRFKVNVGHTEDEAFIVNGDKTVAGPRSTKDTREVRCGSSDCYLVVMATATPAGNMVDSVWADRKTFSLVRHVERGFGNRTDVVVENGRIRGAAIDSGKPERKIDEAGPAFDFSVVEEIVGNLPLKENYRSVIRTFDVTQGFRDVGISVVRADMLETAKGKRPVWVVDFLFGTHKATRWIDRESKEGLKWEVDMGNGRRMWGRPPA